jgi:hypothetical protein
MTRLFPLPLLAAALLAGLAVAAPPAAAQSREPLLMEGRQTLYQRVLSRPNATLREEPNDQARLSEPFVAPFTIFYVFQRREVDGEEWLQVGQPVSGPPAGWVSGNLVIPWRQTMVVSFTNPAGRERTLFFDEREPLIDMLESEDLPVRSRELRGEAIDGSLPPGSPVVSIEPAEHIDITEQFYVLPILEAQQTWLASGFTTRVLEVASIPLETDPLNQMPGRDELLRDFTVGIVFVIDTTNSMGPYIDRTREAIRRIYDQIGGSEIARRVSFGMVGYRDSIRDFADLEYDTRVFAPLEANQDPGRFLRQIDAMRPASISSRGFNEDAMAGLKEAIDLPGWEDFEGRYIVLITDAGPRQAADPLSGTGLGPAQINSLAHERGIAIYSLHLLTEAGSGNQAYAADAYQTVSRWPNARPLYFPVDTRERGAFGNTVDRLTDALINQVTIAMDGRLVEIMEDLQDDLAAQTQLVGRAMQLAFLGRRQGTRAPDVFRAWTADRDFDDPRRASLEVRVLLTKNQLSDLRDVLATILDLGRQYRLNPQEFFGQLQSAVANLSRDPNRLGRAEFSNLGDVLGEYLQDLPYTSRILELDERTWLAMGPGAQREILDDIAAKIRLYESYHDRPENWVALYEGAPEGETVFPVPLENLP